jgi:hypothetical protein
LWQNNIWGILQCLNALVFKKSLLKPLHAGIS